ncbi:predicted protein [Chaetoceros tenuissimus]|uniref:Uncharacterized protein n=1 Tax=Chaetoceros tenuissimus TaxID=426638 RepID=A0AAD3HEB8_9STRA|nr:predicted protein [Chaetoceros tenuissimus]
MNTITQPSNISSDDMDNANYTDYHEELPIKAQNTQETISSLESSSSSDSEEDFSFTSLRAKLLGGKAPTNFNLDEHYKKQRKEKILDEKKKIEAKSFLRSFTPVVKRNHDWASPRNVKNEENQKDHEIVVDEGNEKHVSLSEHNEHDDDDMIQGTESENLEKESLVEPSFVQQQLPVVEQDLETAVEVANDKENGLDHSQEINEPDILQQDLSTLNKEPMIPSNDESKSSECITRAKDTDKNPNITCTITTVTADPPEHQGNHIKQPIILNQAKPSVVAIHTSIIDPIRFQPNEQSSKRNDAKMISTDSSPVKKDLVIREYTYDMSNMPEWKYVMKPPERRYMNIFNFCNCDN